jgi:hypothetical protein
VSNRAATPFFSTLIFPLTRLDLERLGELGWEAGPAYGSQKPYDVESRQQLHPDAALDVLLAADNRLHSHRQVETDRLVATVYEVVRAPSRWGGIKGYLIVHLGQKAHAPGISSMTELGQVARPGTRISHSMMLQLGGNPSDVDGLPWKVAPVGRVPTLSLSALGTADDEGLVRWPGSAPEERRLADLTVLRKDAGQIDRPFLPDVEQPTPSHLLAGSQFSLAVVRLRPVRDDHVVRLRTLWTDAFLIEVVLNDELRCVAERVRSLAPNKDRSSWTEVEHQFRTWRTTQVRERRTDHPMELAIARVARKNFGSDELIDRVQSEIDDHTKAIAVQQSDRLARSVLLLTVAALLIPLLLHAASEGRTEWTNGWFLAATAVAAGVLAAVLQGLRRGR